MWPPLVTKPIKTTILLLLIPFLGILTASPVHAQTISLSIWPPLLETIIMPGKSITQVYRLKNLGDDTVIKASVVPFEPGDELGHIRLSSVPNPAIAYFSLQNADLNLPATVPLKAGETQEFVLKIRIPETAPEADHYFTFLFESNTQGLFSGSHTQTLASVGANILLTVSKTGHPVRSVKIEEFSAGSKILDSFSPISFLVRVKNTSQTRLKAIGQIELTNTFNQPLITLPLREDNILTGSVRQLIPTTTWNPFFPIGRYKAIATITPQDSTNTISQTLVFYILPYKALLVFLILTVYYLTIVKKK